jgi:hypothetical protein
MRPLCVDFCPPVKSGLNHFTHSEKNISPQNDHHKKPGSLGVDQHSSVPLRARHPNCNIYLLLLLQSTYGRFEGACRRRHRCKVESYRPMRQCWCAHILCTSESQFRHIEQGETTGAE